MHQTGEPCDDHLEAESGGRAEVNQVCLPRRGRVLGKGIGAQSVHDWQTTEAGRRHDCEIVDSRRA